MKSTVFYAVFLYKAVKKKPKKKRKFTFRFIKLKQLNFSKLEPGDVLLSHGNSHTIIGAERFHFRVRDGIGWGTLAIVAKHKTLIPTSPFQRDLFPPLFKGG